MLPVNAPSVVIHDRVGQESIGQEVSAPLCGEAGEREFNFPPIFLGGKWFEVRGKVRGEKGDVIVLIPIKEVEK